MPEAPQAWTADEAEKGVSLDVRDKAGGAVHVTGLQPIGDQSTIASQSAAHERFHAMKRHKRRVVRLCSVLGIALIVFLLWLAITFPWYWMEFAPKEYSTEVFVVRVTACAVEVREGPSRKVFVNGQSSSLDVSSEPLPLRALSVRNKKGCLHIPFFQCHKVCVVRIEVPAGDATKRLQIFQESGDTTPGLTVDVNGVKLQDLLIRGVGGNWWDFAGSTLELSMRSTTVEGALYASLQGGAADVRESLLKGPVDLRSQLNSVSILDVPVPQPSEPLRLRWRQVDMRVYIGATTLGYSSADKHPVADPDPTGAFTPCDSQFLLYNFGNYYDVNKDGFVNTAEFVETMGWKTYWDSLGMCCGSRCPFVSWCDGVAYQTFSIMDDSKDGSGGYDDRTNFLSLAALWNRVKEKGGLGAMLVPACHRNLDLMPPLGAELKPSTTASPVLYEDVRTKMSQTEIKYTAANGAVIERSVTMNLPDGSELTESWNSQSITNSRLAQTEFVPSRCTKDSDCRSSYCKKNIGATAGTCSYRPAQAYAYVISAWGPCNKTCGGGSRTRQVSCVGKEDGLHYPLTGGDAPCSMPVPSLVESGCAPDACVSPKLPAAGTINCTVTPDQDLDEDEVRFTLIARGVPLGKEAADAHIASYVVRWGLDSLSPMPNLDEIAQSAPVASALDELEIHVEADTDVPRGAVSLLLFARSAHGLENLAASVSLRDAVPKLSASSSWLVAAGGEVRVLVRQDNPSSATVTLPDVAKQVEQAYADCTALGGSHTHCIRARTRALNERMTQYCPEGKTPTKGLRLLASHAKMLQTEVAKRFGNLLSTEDGLVVIDVAASPGVPASRWMYATRPVFLSIDPAWLFFLSAGLLLPTVKHYRVALMDTACDVNFTNYAFESTDGDHQVLTYSDQHERFEQIYEQLFYAFHSDGFVAFNSPGLRGVLVMLGAAHRPEPDSPEIYEFKKVSGGWRMQGMEVTDLHVRVITAMWLSIITGLVIGILCMLAAIRYLQVLINDRRRLERGRQRTLAMFGEIADEDEEPLGNQRTKKPSKLQSLLDHPFTRPLPLITMLVLEPLRRKMVVSLEKFVVERCILHNASRHDIAKNHKPVEGAMQVIPNSPAEGFSGKGKHQPFVYMREFRRQYEVFCLRENLAANNTVKEIEDSLIMKHDCRISSLTVRRLRGLKWARNGPKSVPDPGRKPLGADSTPLEVMQAFFEAHLVQGAKDSFKCYIDLEDRYGPTGKMRLGLVGKLNAFCNAHGCNMLSVKQLSPTNTEGALYKVCKMRNVPFKELQVCQIYGISFVDPATINRRGIQVSKQWYLVQLATVAVHLSVLVGPSALLMVYAMVNQSTYARTTAVNKDVPSWEDVCGKYPARAKFGDMFFIPRTLIVYNLVIFFTTLLRVLIYYLELPQRGFMKSFTVFIALAYSAVLVFHSLVVFVLVGVWAAWFVLAALIDPTRFLPYGAAVIVTVIVVKSTASELQAAALMIKKACRKIFDTRFAVALRKAKAEIQEEKQDQMARQMIEAAGGGMRRRQIMWEEDVVDQIGLEEEELQKNRRPNPGDLFSVLDKNENGEVELVEFRKVLQRLDCGIQPSQMEQLFAYCDVDSSGTISEKELAESWEFLVSTMMESIAQSGGVGTTDIFITCAMLVVALAVLMAFIFLAIQGWYNNSSFDSMVQTALVSLSSAAVKRARAKVAAEGDDETVKATVGNLTQLDLDGGDDGPDDGGGDGDGEGDGEGDGDGGADGGG